MPLILSMISLALVALLSGATIYSLGDSFSEQKATAQAAEFINVGQQTAAAFTIARLDGKGANVWINTLVPEYITELPKYDGGDLYFHDVHKQYMIAFVSDAVCADINKRAGIPNEDHDITNYTFSCVPGSNGVWPLAYYKVINADI